VKTATTPNFLVGTLGILPKSIYLARELERRGVTHVHAHFATHPAMAAFLIHRLTGIEYSFTAHAHDIYVHRAMLREKAAEARFVATISDHNRRLLAEYAPLEKIEVVHCGIDLDRYPVRATPPSPFEIVSVASLQPYKGIECLIRACAHLRTLTDAPFRCRVAGGGELERPLRRLITELGLGDCVELLGPQTEEVVAALLQQAHCFALPSTVEPNGKMDGLPVALMEALAVGLPVVASDLSGIPELIEDGVSGLLVPPADPDALAAALAAVQAEPERAAELGRAGRARVEAGFTSERSAAQLAVLFA
jgi:glycosyltransferase involved in cell wall biosynthesis